MQLNDSMLNKFNRSCITCFSAYQSSERQKTMSPSSLNLSLVNLLLLWSTLQQKLYRQEIRDIGH